MLAKNSLRKVSANVLSPAVVCRHYTNHDSYSLVKPGESSRQPLASATTARSWSQLKMPLTNAGSSLTCNAHRAYSTAAGSQPSTSDSTSLFQDNISLEAREAWDHIFEDIEKAPPLIPLRGGKASLTGEKSAWGARRPGRHDMTVGESNIFQEMFDLVFEAVDGTFQRQLSPTIEAARKPQHGLSSLYDKIRQHSPRVQWTTAADEELDLKREKIAYCETDVQLLDWAMREVFEESRQYEAAAREAMAKRDADKDVPVQLQPPTYPHVLALLIRTFREKYRDPHLALSMFDHARHLSIPSFVFGCTTPAYNELIETKWRCFRDLQGVCDALEEMRVNGVEIDNKTRSLAEEIRKEVGARNLWHEEAMMGSGEVWDMLSRIEQLTARMNSKHFMRSWRKKPIPLREQRKREAMQEPWKEASLKGVLDGSFDQWGPAMPQERRAHA